jgi:hypothetical protein
MTLDSGLHRRLRSLAAASLWFSPAMGAVGGDSPGWAMTRSQARAGVGAIC